MERRKSELPIQPKTTGNVPERTRTREVAAKQTELLEGKMTGVSEPEEISTKLQRMAELASKKDPKMVLTSLAQHIDLNWLIAAHRMTRKDGAVGIDGQTAKDYSLQLVDNLRGLLERFKSGSYRAPAVKRVLIPKGDGKTRPIGIPTYEDKVLQRAVVMVLDEVYEQDFLDCSYGFRCGRGAHQALDVLWKGLMSMGGGFVLEIDIESFFDTLVHKHLGEFLDQRVRDGVIRRAIGKWLKAGVLDKGQWLKSEQGSPQGGVISPLLANIYLHEVLDVWFEHDVKPQLKGKAFMVRYADDAALVFANEEDAQRVYKIIAARFEKYGLKLHPTKTRLIDFRSPRRGNGEKPETFDMLGFTHYWGQSRRGQAIIQRKTSSKSFRRALLKVTEWCRLHRHDYVGDQHVALCRKVKGHYAYFGVTGNSRMLSTFVLMVERAWHKWLDRRSQRAKMTWERFKLLLKRHPLPAVYIVHSYKRQAAKP